MKKKNEEKLEKITLEKSSDVELARRQVSKFASSLATNIRDFDKIAVIAIVEKSSAPTQQLRQIGTYLPLSSIPQLREELTDFLSAYNVWLRFHSFCRLGMFSSLVFTFFGAYLSYIGYLSIGVGVPLTVLFALLSFVFLTKYLQYRKFLHET